MISKTPDCSILLHRHQS